MDFFSTASLSLSAAALMIWGGTVGRDALLRAGGCRPPPPPLLSFLSRA